MSIFVTIVGFLIMAAIFFAIVSLLRILVPVRFGKAVVWGLKNKRKGLTLGAVAAVFVASLMVFSAFNFHFYLFFGKAEAAVVLGENLDHITYINPEKKEEGVKEFETIVASVARAYLYPGQTFKDAVRDLVLIKYPGYDAYNILFTHPAIYIFINLIAVLFVLVGTVTGFILMMLYAVSLGIYPKPLQQHEMAQHFKASTGMSFPKALGIVALVFVINGIGASLLSQRYNPVIEQSKAAAAEVSGAVLARAVPGTVLDGLVVGMETFSTTEYATRMDEGKTNRRTNTLRYTAYMVRFDEIYEFPVFVNRVFYNEAQDPEAVVFQAHLDSGAPTQFTVTEDSGIIIQPE